MYVKFGLRVCFCLVAAAVAFAAPDRVLLIGVGNYPAPINSLPGIDKDLNSMQESAILLGFPANSIHRLMDSEAKLSNIRREIQTWLIDGGPKGRVLIYFSGHGSLVDGKPVLVNYDTILGERTLNNVLVGSDLGRMVEQIPSQEVLLIVDACHSGRTTDTKSVDGVVPKFLWYPGMAEAPKEELMESSSKGIGNHLVIAACLRTEVAGATSKGSLLTSALSSAFQQLASSGKGITIDAVRPSLQELSAGRTTQHPEISGNTKLGAIDWRGAKPSNARLQQVLEDQVRRATYRVRASISKSTYADQELMQMTVDLEKPGYLNIIAVSEGEAEAVVLFPNRNAPQNRVEAGRVSIPGAASYRIRQNLPAGMSRQQVVVYVLVTENPANLYAQGVGNGVFKMLDDTRGPVVEAAGGDGAARLEYSIVK